MATVTSTLGSRMMQNLRTALAACVLAMTVDGQEMFASFDIRSGFAPLHPTTESDGWAVADPIYPTNGEVRIRRTDYAMESLGFAFSFTRTYRSGHHYDGPLGHGWDHNLNQRLVVIDANNIDFYPGESRVLAYVKSGTVFLPPSGIHDRIRLNGSVYLRETASGHTYVYGATDDSAKFRLTQLSDRNSRSQTLAYNSTSASTGRLVSTTDSTGRTYTFTYDTNGYLEYLSDYATTELDGVPARQLQYEYDDGDLISVTELPGESNARLTTYTYDDAHRVLTITDPKENAKTTPVPFVRNFYDGATGKLLDQEYGPEAASSTKGTQIYTFDYTTANKTEVYDREGGRKVYEYDGVGLMTKLSWKNSAGAITFVEEYTYDSDSNQITMKNALGNLRIQTFDHTNSDPRSRGNLLSIKTADSSGSNALVWTYQYDSNLNVVTSAVAPNGSETTYQYDATGNLTRSTIDAGSGGLDLATAYAYDTNGRLTSVTSPEGRQRSYDYDGQHRVVAIRGDTGTGGLNVTQAEFQYDVFGNLSTTEDALGNITTIVSNRFNDIVSTTGPLGDVTTYAYDRTGNLTAVSVDNSSGQGSGDFVVDLEYDILDNLVSRTEDVDTGVTRLTTYAYDADDQLTLVTYPEGNKVKYVYDVYGRNTEVIRGYTSAVAATTKYFYSAVGQLTRVEEPNGSTHATTFEFDHHGRQTTATDALGNYVRTEYSSDLVSAVMTVPYGGSTSSPMSKATYHYDTANRLTEVRALAKDSGGTNIGDGWLASVTTYDDDGLVVSTADDASNEVEFFYDGLARLTLAIDPLENEVSYTYSSRGDVLTRTIKDKKAAGGFQSYAHTYAYDAVGRMTASTDPASETWTYTYDYRNLVTMADPNGAKSYMKYDELDRLVQARVEYDGTNTLTTAYAYDKNDRLTSTTNPRGKTSTFAYDALDRRTAATLPNSTAYSYEYDANSNLITLTDPNATETEFFYDHRGNLISKTYPVTAVHLRGEATATHYAYDALGRMTRAEDTDSRVDYQYNTLGQVEAETMTWGNPSSGTPRTVEWDYNSRGLVAAIRYPGATSTDGQLEYTYDETGKLTEMRRVTGVSTSSLVGAWTYEGSRVLKREHGNGTRALISYGSRAEVSSILHERIVSGGPNESIVKVSYAYDDAMQVIGEGIEHFENDGTASEDKGFTFTYDKAARLTKVYRGVPVSQIATSSPSTSTHIVEYEQDLNGNRTTVETTPTSSSTVTDTYTVNDVDDYTSITFGSTTIAYTYDSVGNRKAMDTGIKSWHPDPLNQLAAVDASGAEYAEYDYDALGRRFAKRFFHDGYEFLQSKRYYYAGSALIQTYDVTVVEEEDVETLELEHFWGVEGILRMARYSGGSPNGAVFHHGGGDGTVHSITADDVDAEIEENYRYDEFGGAIAYAGDTTTLTSAMWGNDWLWQGAQYDLETLDIGSGVALYDADYDPEIARPVTQGATSGGGGGGSRTPGNIGEVRGGPPATTGVGPVSLDPGPTKGDPVISPPWPREEIIPWWRHPKWRVRSGTSWTIPGWKTSKSESTGITHAGSSTPSFGGYVHDEKKTVVVEIRVVDGRYCYVEKDDGTCVDLTPYLYDNGTPRTGGGPIIGSSDVRTGFSLDPNGETKVYVSKADMGHAGRYGQRFRESGSWWKTPVARGWNCLDEPTQLIVACYCGIGVAYGYATIVKLGWGLVKFAKGGFNSYSSLKRALGPAGEGKHWHHIVEQSQVGKFGSQAIHNVDNVVAIPKDIHTKISAFYSSKPDFAGGQRVREWLRSQSFEQQRAFGLQVLRDFGVGR